MTQALQPQSFVRHSSGLAHWIPWLIYGIATIHTVFAFVAMPEPWLDIAREGFVNTVEPDAERESVLWFFYAGIGFFAIGSYARQAARLTGRIPWQIPAYLLGIGGTMVILEPVSGGWLLLVVVVLAVIASRKG